MTDIPVLENKINYNIFLMVFVGPLLIHDMARKSEILLTQRAFSNFGQ